MHHIPGGILKSVVGADGSTLISLLRFDVFGETSSRSSLDSSDSPADWNSKNIGRFSTLAELSGLRRTQISMKLYRQDYVDG